MVKSVDAFTDALASNEGAQSIQVGFYQLKKEMKASDAVDILVEPDNLIRNSVTIPEGLRVVDIVEILADKTDFSKKRFNKVLDSPDELGLPPYARGNAEGYLFPATYAFPPNSTPTTMLKAMVDRWKQAAEDADLEGVSEDTRLHARGADDDREPGAGGGTTSRHGQGGPGDLQPPV